MKRIHNKDGPDIDIGVPTMPLPRDGTERRPRDGTERRPRDGTERRPRDETMPQKDSLETRYYYQLTRKPQDVRIHGRPPSKWRKTRWSIPASGTGKGEVCPVVNEKEK
jgi:hypothetical protein